MTIIEELARRIKIKKQFIEFLQAEIAAHERALARMIAEQTPERIVEQ